MSMKWTNPGHEFDALGERLLKIKTIYIYGTDYQDSSYFAFAKFGFRVVFIPPRIYVR